MDEELLIKNILKEMDNHFSFGDCDYIRRLESGTTEKKWEKILKDLIEKTKKGL